MGLRIGSFLGGLARTAVRTVVGGNPVAQFGGNLLSALSRRTGGSTAQIQDIARRLRGQTGLGGQDVLRFLGGGRQPWEMPYESTGVELGPARYSHVTAGGGGATAVAQVPAVTCKTGSCLVQRQMPDGTVMVVKGRLVRQPYVRKIDRCRPFELGNLELVPAGSCTTRKRRRFNPANGRAAIRAAARLQGTHKLLKRIEKAIRKAAPRTGGSSCSCKGGKKR